MSELTGLVARLPWVTRLERTQDCDSYRYGHMPLKALHDPAVRAKYECRARARWQFRALPETDPALAAARSGTYCWRHLFCQIWGYPPEEERYRHELAVMRGPVGQLAAAGRAHHETGDNTL